MDKACLDININHFNGKQLLINDWNASPADENPLHLHIFNNLILLSGSGFKWWICHLSFHMHYYSTPSHEYWTLKKMEKSCTKVIFLTETCLRIFKNCKSHLRSCCSVSNVHWPSQHDVMTLFLFINVFSVMFYWSLALPWLNTYSELFGWSMVDHEYVVFFFISFQPVFVHFSYLVSRIMLAIWNLKHMASQKKNFPINIQHCEWWEFSWQIYHISSKV